jgi:hypothetical protein
LQVELLPDKALNRKIARLPGVKAAVKAEAEAMTRTASGLLAQHRKTGAHHIELSKADSYRATDWYVSLVGKAAMAIETGHNNSGRYDSVPGRVAGLRILARTIAAHRHV